MASNAVLRILVSRFPEHITPGALPILPTTISIGRNSLKPGTWIVYRWFDDGDVHHQAPPEFYDKLEDALSLVPDGYVLDRSCPEEFAMAAYRLPQAKGVLS